MILFDTYAWVEYFKGTDKGKQINKLLGEGNCFTPMIVVSEISDWYAKQNMDSASRLEFVKANSIIQEFDFETAKNAGIIKQHIRKKYKNNFGLSDAIILATARSLSAKVVTGDFHFKPLSDIEFIG